MQIHFENMEILLAGTEPVAPNRVILLLIQDNSYYTDFR